LRLTTSWDDGHPLDLRVAELLAKHGFKGTFYVPQRNSEGRPVLDQSELRSLDASFEIGAHTVDHVRLDTLPSTDANRQITESKEQLEQALGHLVAGFCYPGGAHNSKLRNQVKSAGFRYARTVCNFSVRVPTDRFQVPTTIQLFPHQRWTYCKNFARGGSWQSRASVFALSLRHHSLERQLETLLRHASAHSIFHMWGHSWELEANGLWSVLDAFLRTAAQVVSAPQRVDNRTLYS
jgi:peptidoglycan/xylan/chitin deacetylase (PgdA/CDA1 family)